MKWSKSRRFPTRPAGGLASGSSSDPPSPQTPTRWSGAAEERASLELPLAPERLKVMRPFGRTIPFEQTAGRCSIPVVDRLWLRLENLKPDEAARLLKDQN